MTPVNFLNPVASTATAVATKLYGDVNRRSAELSTGFADASIDIARTQISSNLTSSAKVQRGA